jgi:hypothetical protein
MNTATIKAHEITAQHIGRTVRMSDGRITHTVRIKDAAWDTGRGTVLVEYFGSIDPRRTWDSVSIPRDSEVTVL